MSKLIFVMNDRAPSLASQLPQGLAVLKRDVSALQYPVDAGLPAMAAAGLKKFIDWLPPADPAT
ncbi:hypothetical protein ACFZAC_07720 [Pseudomonas fluorescens]|uniref:hypothetical protein n=1 Tax=Pseudomonas fluorescens TaxID=294 RepID=UPI003748C7DE